jgi:hypothetical protein
VDRRFDPGRPAKRKRKEKSVEDRALFFVNREVDEKTQKPRVMAALDKEQVSPNQMTIVSHT